MFVHSVPVPGGLELNSPEDSFCLWRCNRNDKRYTRVRSPTTTLSFGGLKV